MGRDVKYTPGERLGLIGLAVAGFVAVNGVFALGVLFRREALAEAPADPIAAAFVAEAAREASGQGPFAGGAGT